MQAISHESPSPIATETPALYNTHLRAATEIARATSSIQDAQTLIEQSVDLIQKQFGFDYVGLFLLDEAGENAVLRAGAGEASQGVLAREHKCPLEDESSTISWSITHQEARIALDDGQGTVNFTPSPLPKTHSELALPLIFQGQVIGALSLQSCQEAAFNANNIQILSNLADQLAFAIENAHLRAELERSQRYYRALAENAIDVFLVVDAQGITRYVNPSMQRILGYTPEERIGKDPTELLHPEDVPQARATLAELLSTPNAERTLELRARTKDGQWRVLKVSARNCLDDPDIQGVIIHYQDITASTQAEAAMRSYQRGLEILNALAASLSQAADLSDVLEAALEQTLQLLELKAGWVTLINNEGGFDLVAAHGLPAALKADFATRSTLCNCQRLGLKGKVTRSSNIQDCERLRDNPSDGMTLHASVPLFNGPQWVGLLNLASADSEPFSPGRLRLLNSAGALVSIAIERASLYNQIKNQRLAEQEALLRLSQALLSTQAPQQVLDLAVEEAARSLQTEFAAITLTDPEETYYSVAAQHGWPADVWSDVQAIPVDDQTDMGRSIHHRAPVIITDRHKYPDDKTLEPLHTLDVRARLIVPMLVEGYPLGALAVNDRQPRAWSADEIRLLSLIANTTAQALARARLVEAGKRREAIIDAVNYAANTFMHSPWWERDILDVLAHLGKAASVDRVYVFKNHHGEDGVLLTSQRYEWAREGVEAQIDNPDLQNLPLVNSGFTRWVEVLSQGKPIAGPVHTFPASERQVLEEQAILALVVVPIFVEGHWWGFIGFDDCTHERRWSSIEVDALLTAANTLGSAIQRHAQERFLTSLNEITLAALNAPDFDTLCQTLADQLSSLFESDTCYIVQWDEQKQIAIPVAASGTSSSQYRAIRVQPDEPTLTEAVLRSKHPIAIENTASSHHISQRISRMFTDKSKLGLPLIAGEHQLGAAIIGYNQPHVFTAEEIARGEQAGAQVALAIAKNQLDKQTQQHATELEERVTARTAELISLNQRLLTLNIIANRLSSTLDTQLLLQEVVHLIREKLGYSFVSIGLLEGEELVFKAIAGGKHPVLPGLRSLRVPEEGVSGWVVAHRQLRNVPDVSQEPRYVNNIPHANPARSELIVPIQHPNHFYGVLSIDSDQLAAFGPEEEQLFTAIADQLALALENARSFAQATQQRDEAQHAVELLFEQTNQMVSMNRIASKLMGAVTLKEAAHILVTGLQDEFQVDKSTLWTVVPGAEASSPEQLTLIAQLGMELSPQEALNPGEMTAPLLQVWREGKRLWWTGGCGEADCGLTEDWLMSPLKVHGKTLAILVIKDSAMDADTLRILLNQAALGLAAARAHEHLQRQTDTLEAVNYELQRATQAKTEFINRMSHELRTPLNAILGFANLLHRQRAGTLNEKQARFVKNILDSADHQLALVNDVLDLARVEAGKLKLDLQETAVGEIVASAINMVKNQATARKLRLLYEEPGIEVTARADPVRLRQIIVNLLSNAIKFTPEGGEVRVQYSVTRGPLETDGSPPPEVDPVAESQTQDTEDRHLVITVADDGIGIAPEDHARVFTEFEQIESTLNRSHEGTGLGLALTRQLLELHGGRIWFESQLGVGTTFFVALPL